MKKLLYISSLLAISIGVVLVFGGLWAVVFTYQNVSQENIITPEDASIPNAPVRGPFTLHSQALHLAIITYLFSGLISLLGFISIWTGIVFGALNKKYSR